MTFSSPWIYFAGPLFTRAEIQFNQTLCDRLRESGYRVYLPQEACSGITAPSQLFQRCMEGLDGASLVLVVLDGADADSGSCFEMGYAYAKGLEIIGLRTDFRGSGEHQGLNLMLTNSCAHLLITPLHPDSLRSDSDKVTILSVGEDVSDQLLSVLSNRPGAEAAKV